MSENYNSLPKFDDVRTKICAPLGAGEESKPYYILIFEDDDKKDRVVLNGSREAAIKLWLDACDNWNCWLFEPVATTDQKDQRIKELEGAIRENIHYVYSESFDPGASRTACDELQSVLDKEARG